MIDLTVVTSTIPERAPMLHELRQCLAQQTVKPTEWRVKTDWDRIGPAHIINELVEEASTEWVFRCDDDDLYAPNHFERLQTQLVDGADIVYTWCVVDPPGWIGRDELQVCPPIEAIEAVNWIPSAAAVRRDLWTHLGGYQDVRDEDHNLWKRAYRAGAQFVVIPEVTWTYRLGDWPHLSQPEDE